jgi:hypothetical protein
MPTMAVLSEASPPLAHDGSARKRIVFVAGSGRSGTSIFTGVLRHLGLHVPQPEVLPDETNPAGFGEPQWVVDYHNRLLRRTGVQISDGRPSAWQRAEELASQGDDVRDRLQSWLAGQLEQADELVIKDPRLSWFLELWGVVAQRLGAEPLFATLLRPPPEVVGSKQKYYDARVGEVARLADWVNMMLHTERATRSSDRVFVRYADLLDDWETTIRWVGDTLGLRAVQTAQPTCLHEAGALIDLRLRRVQLTWDDLDAPAALVDLAQRVWDHLNRLAEPGGDVPAVHDALDALRIEYVRMYADAEAMARSSVLAAKREAQRRERRLLLLRPDATRLARSATQRISARMPHRLRTVMPTRVRSAFRRQMDKLRGV